MNSCCRQEYLTIVCVAVSQKERGCVSVMLCLRLHLCACVCGGCVCFAQTHWLHFSLWVSGYLSKPSVSFSPPLIRLQNLYRFHLSSSSKNNFHPLFTTLSPPLPSPPMRAAIVLQSGERLLCVHAHTLLWHGMCVCGVLWFTVTL